MERRKFISTTSQAAALMPLIPASSFFKRKSPVDTVLPEISLDTPHEFHRSLFYKPVNAWAGDFIPLFAKGAFQLFYLQDWRNREEFGEGTPWFRVCTNDFVHFKECGEMIHRGTKAEQDLYIFTGSAIEAEGKFHIFYTGHNPYFAALGKPQQGIMHAVSDDLEHWKKTGEPPFFAPKGNYEPNDWRDPFVFWNDDDKEYNMLCAARFNKGIPSRRRGLTALSTSKDLIHWQVKDPFYAPGLYITHECPDLFKMGDWWYLIFSEYTDLVRTRYRMSRSLKGPWIIPSVDDFDGHAFYAAKTASDGHNRFLFGWNPTRSNQSDRGDWNWGGNLVVHELRQLANGELTVCAPKTIASAIGTPNPLHFDIHTTTGQITAGGNGVQIKAPGTFGAALAGEMPQRCRIETTVTFDKGTRFIGLIFRASHDFENAYFVRLDIARQRMVFDKWPRSKSEIPFMVELERPLKLQPDTPVKLQVLIDGTVGVVYCNDQVAMNFRMYDFRTGRWGVFAEQGAAAFSQLQLCS